MRRISLLLPFALLGADPQAPPGITIQGKVSVFLVGAEQRTFDRAYVYLQSKDRHRGHDIGGASVTEKIVQLHETFDPPVLVVPIGATVQFPNLDHTEHNVFSPTQPTFDLGRYNTKSPGPSHVFEDAEEFDIFCDIHPKMEATVKVVGAPKKWVAKVEHGAFHIDDVHDGSYVLHAWAPHSTEVEVPVIVSNGVVDGGSQRLLDVIHVQLGASQPHKRKDGGSYPMYAPH